MKHLKRLCAAFVLTLLLTLSAAAGEIPNPVSGQMETPRMSQIDNTKVGEIQTTVSGQMETPRSAPTMEVVLNLIFGALSLV